MKLYSIVVLSCLYANFVIPAAGTVDATFSDESVIPGIVTTNIGIAATALAVAVQSDGKLVAAGQATDSSGCTHCAVVRYNNNGTLDTTFGTNGKVTSSRGVGAQANALVVQHDGKIVIAGTINTDETHEQFAVIRYHTDGSLDTSFGNQGYVATPLGSSSYSAANALALQADGKLVVVGYYASHAGIEQCAVVRYTTQGTLDTTFNGTGIVMTPLDPSGSIGQSVALQKDGKIVVAGQTYQNNGSQIAVARYTSTGSLDTSFNGTGLVVTNIGTTAQANAVVVQQDGAIVVTGPANPTGDFEMVVVRYTHAGKLDTTFNGTGKACAGIQKGPSLSNALAVQCDNKLVVVGSITINGVQQLAVARFTQYGALDHTFNSASSHPGIVGAAYNAASNGYAVAVQQDGKIVVAGATSTMFLLARYHADAQLLCIKKGNNYA